MCFRKRREFPGAVEIQTFDRNRPETSLVPTCRIVIIGASKESDLPPRHGCGMTSSAFNLFLALVLCQTPDSTWQFTPQFQPGLELVYVGDVREESNSSNVQFQRHYRLETLLFVLDKQAKFSNVALMTTLNVPTPGAQAKQVPSHVRLELAKVDEQGQLLLAKTGRWLAPLEGPAYLEAGFLLEAPLVKVGKNSVWDVAEEGRGIRSIRIVGTELCSGVSCVKIACLQQSDDWDRPRADRTAWRRQETIWFAPQLGGIAYRVERLVERRDPARERPTYRCETHYELISSPLRYSNSLFEDRQLEIVQARKFQDDAAPFFIQPAEYRVPIEALRKKVAKHLEQPQATPYRKATLHLATRLEGAIVGGSAAPESVGEPRPIQAAVGVGQKVPDLLLADLVQQSSLRLSKLHGKPILIVYLNPDTEIGEETVRFANRLHRKYEGSFHLVGMPLGKDAEALRKWHAEQKIPFPICDGNAFHVLFRVEATPRFIVLDAAGNLRAAFTGWGLHSEWEIARELKSYFPKKTSK